MTKLSHRDVCLLEFLLCQEGDMLPARIALQLAALGNRFGNYRHKMKLILFRVDDTQLSETAELGDRLLISQLGLNINQHWEEVTRIDPN